MTGHAGNSQFFFSATWLRVSEKQNSLWSDLKILVFWKTGRYGEVVAYEELYLTHQWDFKRMKQISETLFSFT